jgi:hypothetical protein
MSCTPILQVPTLGLHKMLPSLFVVAAGSGLIIQNESSSTRTHCFPSKAIIT